MEESMSAYVTQNALLTSDGNNEINESRQEPENGFFFFSLF